MARSQFGALSNTNLSINLTSDSHVPSPFRQNRTVFIIGLLLITLVGVALRFWGLFHYTFSGDEALFATYARYIAVWRDPMLLTVATPVDKPPLLFYAQALFYPLQGAVEWAARLPNFIASVLLIPLVGRMAFDLSNNQPWRGWIAAAIIACSPIAIQHSPTAFTDPLLTFWITLALAVAINPSRKTSAGLWLGLGFLTKYQAILFLPLMLWCQRHQRNRAIKTFLTFGVCVLVLLLWDWLPNGQIDLFGRQVAAYGGIHFAPPEQIRHQAVLWGQNLLYLLGWGLTPLIIGWLSAITAQKKWGDVSPIYFYLATYAAGYLLIHLLIVNLSEPRYALPILPLLALVVSGLPAVQLYPMLKRIPVFVPTIITVLCLLQALPALHGNYPFGGRPDNDHGASQIAQHLIDKPYGTVLYDHSHSWHWRYHLFYKGVHVEWFENPADLIENLTAFFDPLAAEKRYIALDSTTKIKPQVENTFIAEGYRLEPISTHGTITLYVISRE